MSDTALPDDRAIVAAARRLKAYSAYKGRQTQSELDPDQSLDADLATVETWAADADDDGIAWAEQRRTAADRDERTAARWRAAVADDQRQAAEEAEQRRRVSPAQIREELNRRIDEHAAAVAALAETKEPGFRGKLSQVRRESLQAKEFLNENLEQSLEDTAQRAAAARQQRKEVAARFEQRAEAGRAWRAQYGQRPDLYAQGQRDDVRAALDRIAALARTRIDELTLLGSVAGPCCRRLAEVVTWSESSAGQIDAAAPGGKSRGEIGRGVEQARAAFAELDAFEAQMERESNELFAAFRTWTQTNTERARRWIHSDSPKHRKWAEAWLGTRGTGHAKGSA